VTQSLNPKYPSAHPKVLNMPRYYGVRCDTCKEIIELGRCESEDDTATVGVPSLEPIPRKCGSSHLYGSDDVVEFEKDDG
jgi:hypothetical protein